MRFTFKSTTAEQESIVGFSSARSEIISCAEHSIAWRLIFESSKHF
jgi:hypothetical protein